MYPAGGDALQHHHGKFIKVTELLANRLFLSFIACALITVSPPSSAKGSAAEKERAEIRKSSQQILRQLYRANPSAKKMVTSSAGYATFSNFGMKIFLAGGGSGTGVAVNNHTKAETFMKMVEVQAGLGFGIKKFRLVFVFDSETALNAFTESGWESSAQSSAAATDGRHGGAYQGAVIVAPGVHLFQLTDKGLALEATVKETKYYKNDDLNKK